MNDDVVHRERDGKNRLPEDDGWTIPLRSMAYVLRIAPNLDATNRGTPGRSEKRDDGSQKLREVKCDGFKAE